MSSASCRPAEEPIDLCAECVVRRALDLGLAAVVCAYGIAAFVGLPLFQDGAWYFFKIATLGVAELPNQRYTALLPQLPAVWAASWVDDAVMLRHIFALSYVALPLASLIGCWLIVRRHAPALMLFPLLWFLLNLVNFSGVSELLSSLYLTWPLVLAMLLAPSGRWTRVYAGIAAPSLVALHPLAFLPAFALALLAAALAWTTPCLRRVWALLGGALLVAGLSRLLWTIAAANHYERGRFQPESALNYLLTETLGQHLLLAAVLLLGVLLAVAMQVRQQPALAWSLRFAGAIAWLLPAITLMIGYELINGEGIKLKSGIIFLSGLALMGLAALVVLAPAALSAPARMRSGIAFHGRGWIPALIAVCMSLLLLAKSGAWWTATRGLQNLLAATSADCITLSASEPFGLQWPWMRIIDDWATPMNALAFRPYLVLASDRGVEPVPLLLRPDRCEIARETGKVYATSWAEADLDALEARFGPLRLSGQR